MIKEVPRLSELPKVLLDNKELVGAAAVFAALGVMLHAMYDLGERVSDIDVVLFAAREILAGESPYGRGIGPTGEWDFYYPLTAAVAFLPIVWMNDRIFHLAMIAIVSGALAWGVARDRPAALPLFFSAAFVQAALHVQWPPILMVAVFFPAVAWLYVLKPHSGLALFAAYPSWGAARAAFLGGGLLVGVSFALKPEWAGEWVLVIAGTSHFKAAVFHSGGWILLLALIRWRQPEARLLVALTLIPRTAALYEMLFLFLIPRSAREGWVLAVGSWMLLAWHGYVLDLHPDGGPEAFAMLELGALLTMYLPALVMVLRRVKDPANASALDRITDSTANAAIPAWTVGQVREP